MSYVLIAAFGLLLAGCAVLTPLPDPTTLKDRLAKLPTRDLPLQAPVTISWNDHQVPFIEAATDADLAFALGLVHAHLRLGQMEIVRRISQGRLSEMGGPLATDIDHGLRILDFGRAASEMEKGLPAETRTWLTRYVEGVNHYLFAAKDLPQEFAVLGLNREPWKVADLLTIVRLGGTDVNWLIWFNLLRLRQNPEWPTLWARLVEAGTASLPSMDADGRAAELFGDILKGLSRSGSNSVVVAGSRTASGAALIASDPHLGINLPNIWLIAGMKSPSVHAVGLMFPGLPFVAVGRNEWIGWGGTNMRSASSDLYDVSRLAPKDVSVRRETLKVRWWFDKEVEIRETPYGPVITDAPSLEGAGGPFALKWVGHTPSDEITAMLKVNRARDFAEFRAAFKTFAVPAQNMMYADARGHIGQVMALHLPVRARASPKDLVLDPADPAARWPRIADATNLPFSYDPARGWLGSANNKPVEAPFPIGYFFSPDDRMVRMKALLDGERRIGVEDLTALQQDVYMQSAVELRDALVAWMAANLPVPAAGSTAATLLAELRGWDGYYRTDSRGPVAFELVFHHFKDAFYNGHMDPEAARNFISVADIKRILADDVARAAHGDGARLSAALRDALGKSAEAFGQFANWGEMHRLGLSHALGNLPVIGGRYRFGEYPVGGSTDTLMKTSHSSTDERHFTRYGSQARHVSDLADPDANYFLILGGQDGWFASSTFVDQVPLWLEGRYIQVPMRPETVRRLHPHVTLLAPRQSGSPSP